MFSTRVTKWIAAGLFTAAAPALAAHVTHKHAVTTKAKTPHALVATHTPALAGKAHAPKLTTHSVKAASKLKTHAKTAAKHLTHKPRTTATHTHKALNGAA